MITTADKLANRLRRALRALDEMGFNEDEPINGGDCVEVVAELLPPLRAILQEYDAERERARLTQPERYVVRWEVDSDAETPEEAAREADGNTSRFYTIHEANGTTHAVDLDAIDYERANTGA